MKIDEKKSVQLLRKHAKTKKDFDYVYRHSQKVKQLAVRIAQKIKKTNPKLKIDLNFVRTAALLHDIGRFEAPPWKHSITHGVLGGKILRKECLSENYIRVCERHLGYWLTKAEVIRSSLPIPKKSYKPATLEEKIISYADKLVYYDKAVGMDFMYRRYKKKHGERIARRLLMLDKEMKKLMGEEV